MIGNQSTILLIIIVNMLWLHLQGQTSPGQHQSSNNIILKVLHFAHILQVNTCSLLEIFLLNSQSLLKYIITAFLYSLAELVEKFQLSLYRHYESGGQSLYRSSDMQAFCETPEPHLFYILVSTIVGADEHVTSERHSHLQQQRIVALLHMLPYFKYLLQITMYLPEVQRIKIVIFYIIY